MNKDVIYIEAEDDITDILAKIKNAKNKIVALVPPKKAGVLRSAVNFKLITKTATKAEKTVVLVSGDESLVRLASAANIPVAKTLQSKPRLPHVDDAEEFGDDEAKSDVIEAEEPEEAPKKIEVKGDEAEADDEPKAKAGSKKSAAKKEEVAEKATTKAVAAKKAKEEDDDVIEEEKPSRKKSNQKVPNFKKYQKFIIAGVIAVLLLGGFAFWALVIAPAVKISVSISTTPGSISQKVTFTSVEGNDDVDNGILYVESKSITKTVEGNFEATGQVDKGEKASGKLTLKRSSPVSSNSMPINFSSAAITVASGTKFSYNGKTYVTTSAATLREVTKNDIDRSTCKLGDSSVSCDLKTDITATVNVVAESNGDSYNIPATTSGWTAGNGYIVSSSTEMTGGTSKIVKIVSDKDLADAEAGLDMSIDNDARNELTDEFGEDYLLISSSFSSDNGKVTTSPAVNEEVGDGVTPKIVKEVKFTIFAVKREDVDRYLKKLAEAELGGDDTQMVHDTGIDKAFIDTFKDTGNGTYSGKLKATYRTGPKITEEDVMNKVKGKGLGEVQTMIKSIKGVKEVKVKSSYFWVVSVPEDPNKISIELISADE